MYFNLFHIFRGWSVEFKQGLFRRTALYSAGQGVTSFLVAYSEGSASPVPRTGRDLSLCP